MDYVHTWCHRGCPTPGRSARWPAPSAGSGAPTPAAPAATTCLWLSWRLRWWGQHGAGARATRTAPRLLDTYVGAALVRTYPSPSDPSRARQAGANASPRSARRQMQPVRVGCDGSKECVGCAGGPDSSRGSSPPRPNSPPPVSERSPPAGDAPRIAREHVRVFVHGLDSGAGIAAARRLIDPPAPPPGPPLRGWSPGCRGSEGRPLGSIRSNDPPGGWPDRSNNQSNRMRCSSQVVPRPHAWNHHTSDPSPSHPPPHPNRHEPAPERAAPTCCLPQRRRAPWRRRRPTPQMAAAARTTRG